MDELDAERGVHRTKEVVVLAAGGGLRRSWQQVLNAQLSLAGQETGQRAAGGQWALGKKKEEGTLQGALRVGLAGRRQCLVR